MTALPSKLSLRGLRMVYPGTVALEDVNIDFQTGRVHALLGKNGAGKSTLVKILSGVVKPTAGRVLLDGHEVSFDSPRQAQRLGVATVHQELSLIPGLTIAENVLFTNLPRKRGFGGMGKYVIDWAQTFDRAKSLLNELEIDLDVRSPVSRLGAAEQQVVEIAKAMSGQPSVLLLDEPTSALSSRECQNLFRLIRLLRTRSVAMVYISHRLHELREIVDDVSVLRDGRCAGTISMAEATPPRIAEMMFGKVLPAHRPPLPVNNAPVAMKVQGLTRRGEFSDVSFELRQGEVLGIAGAVGAGRTELLMSIFGARRPESGYIEINGTRVTQPDPRKMKKLGVGLTPEDRKQLALVQNLSVRENLALATLSALANRGVMDAQRERAMVKQRVSQLHIATSGPAQLVRSLSGGNQQKVVVGNWLNTNPKVMLMDEPTRGIDIHAKQRIFELIQDLSAQGIAIVFVSSELEELVEVCHRIIVLRRGQMVGEVQSDQFDLTRLLAMCMED